MKRTISILLLIILNLTFIYVIIMDSLLTFGLIVGPLGIEGGVEMAKITTKEILIRLTILSFINFLINYFLLKKMIESKKPFINSIIITVMGIIIYIPFFISATESFLKYQTGTTTLQHYLDGQTITEAQVITKTDTFRVQQLDDFLWDIGAAKYKQGPWKFAKKIKLKFKRADGSKDSIFTNGQLFGS